MAAEYVIVGAGPVGLTAALILAQAGKSVQVIEREPGMHTDWRASTFHAPTLEMCEELGLVDDMMAQGIVAELYQIRDWSKGEVAEFNFSELRDVTKYPFRLQLEQYKYSAIIYEHLQRDYPEVEIRFGCTAEAVLRSDPRPALRVTNADGSAEEIACDWLLGTDGANSIVRRSLNISFEGLTYPTRALLLSVSAPLEEWYPDICYVNYIADAEDAPGMLLKIPDVWRVSFKIPDDVSDEQATSDDYVDRMLRGVFGGRDIPVSTERRVFRVHQRAADTFRKGHILLLGDAAHINSPNGGMGLNSGIQDAFDLGRVLPKVADGQLPDTELDAWAARRRNAAVNEVQKISHRNTTELGSKDVDTVNATIRRMKSIAADPERAREWMLEASMLTAARSWYRPEIAALSHQAE